MKTFLLCSLKGLLVFALPWLPFFAVAWWLGR